MYLATMSLNLLWLTAGFRYFAIKSEAAAKLLVPGSQRSSPLFATLRAALPFLGGMNLALACLAGLVLWRGDLFSAPAEKTILLIVFAIAHGSQFAINIPVARRGGRIGESYWDVLRGPMLFIFVVDALMTAINLTCAAFIGW
jgi:hypothetical protein